MYLAYYQKTTEYIKELARLVDRNVIASKSKDYPCFLELLKVEIFLD